MADRMPDQLDPRQNLDWYTKDAIKNADVWTPQTIRREYSRLRDIAQKRLQRLAAAEPESYAYRHNVDKFAPARGQTTEQIAAQLPDLAKFIASKTGTVRGIRAQRNAAVQALQASGYDFVTKENIREFGEYMEAAREKKLGKTIYAEVINAFRFMKDQKIPWKKVKDDFERWIKDRKKLEEYVAKKNAAGKEVNADMVLSEFEKLEQRRKKHNEANRRYRARKKAQKQKEMED